MYPKGKNQPGQRCLRSGRSFENLEVGKAIIRGVSMEQVLLLICPKSVGVEAPLPPVPPVLCLQIAISVGARLQVKSQIRRNIL